MKAGGKTLGDFALAHDPTHKVDAPLSVFAAPIPPKARTFIITAAQNATPVHVKFWAILERIAHHRSATRLVIPLRYKNPTSQWTGSQENAEYWDAAVRPFLFNQRKSLHKHLTILGDMKIQPTASSPLTGAEALSTSSSGIIGHTKLQLRCVATPQGRMAKIMTTTGACTVANYTDSRAGTIGEFHHSLCAQLVELNGKYFHIRQLHYDAKTGSVTDGAAGVRYYPDRVEQAPRPLALAMGDTHVDYICPLVKKATFGKGGMIDLLKPENLIWHDLLDSYSVNPHHFGNPFNAVAKRQADRDDARAEVDRAIKFVRDNTGEGTVSVLIASNHNDMLRRWVAKNDWRLDPVNAEFYLETALAMVRGTKLTGKGTEYPDPFAFWFKRAGVPRTRVLDSDESFMRGGIELSMHGDHGPNGARGSIRNLRRIGVKSIIGHSHTPGIDEGCYQSGTSTRLRLEYNTGAGSWLNCHTLLQADGKRQLIVIVDGKWRA